MENEEFKQYYLISVAKLVGIVTLLLSFSFNVHSNEMEKEVDSAFYFSVLIEATPEIIWPLLFQIDKWKYSIDRLENRVLTGDQEGGSVDIYSPGSVVSTALIKTLKILPNKHYSFSMYANAEKFVGYAAYDLQYDNGKTRLTYKIYFHLVFQGFTDEQVAAKTKEMASELESRQPKELAALKSLVES